MGAVITNFSVPTVRKVLDGRTRAHRDLFVPLIGILRFRRSQRAPPLTKPTPLRQVEWVGIITLYMGTGDRDTL